MRFVPRKTLNHDCPSWAETGALYFVTINAAPRGTSDLVQPDSAASLLESAAHYHRQGRWFARLFLLMPDHVHALLAFPPVEAMRTVICDWKRYTARVHAVRWQRDFFDHRLRSNESWELKADYIRQNPVRKGLVQQATDWPWSLEA